MRWVGSTYNNVSSSASWDTAKAILRGKFIAINAYIKKKRERSQVNNLTFYLKEQEKEKQPQSKVRRREEITKIRAEILK